jgi:predicted ATPase/class 3 adenylate cyclase
MDVAAWLDGQGLGKYARAFADNAIDAAVLPRLTADDLKELGVAAVGDRRRLLDAIAALAAGPAAEAGPGPGGRSRRAERRQLTVLFADLVGSTALAARLDPEETGEVLKAFQAVVAGEVARFGGFVAKLMGDGVLVYFGWPEAQEDAAERAVRAGLAITARVAGLVTPAGEPLAGRVGIATGLVVVGDRIGEGPAQEEAVVGETPNLAARLQQLARPGSVLVAEATRRLVGELLLWRELPPASIAGFAEPVRAFEVGGEGQAEDRFAARHGAELAPLVGREEELALILARWRRAREGEGQVVLLAGEPGVGKSRLVRAVRERLAGEPLTPLVHSCSPLHTTSTLHPVIGLLERGAGLLRDDPPVVRLGKLESLLAEATADLGESLPLLADLLGIPAERPVAVLELPPQRRKERTLAALLDQLAGLAARRPVLALYEDVHWADPTTLELLELVVDRVQHLPVLVLITSRPELVPPWRGRPHVTTLGLGRLGTRRATALVAGLTGGRRLPGEVLEQVLARADGVPLFVEELTKLVLESGLLREAGDRFELVGPLPPLAIPSTLHDSLMARLDRLAAVKEVAQIGAAIGREFGHELLAAVADLDGQALERALDRLVDAELLFRRGTPPRALYSFKHALVRDAAYESLLRSRRQALHATIARVLEERFPETARTAPELLAQHCAAAGLVEPAVAWWQKAAGRALARSADAEAVAQARAGLELVAQLPEGPPRWRAELALEVTLAAALLATIGNAAAETGAAYARARVLCERLGDRETLVPVLSGLATFHQTRAEFAALRAAAEELLQLGKERADVAATLVGERSVGLALFHLGEFRAVRARLGRVLALYDPEAHHLLKAIAAFDMRSVALTYGAFTSLLLGRPDAAAAISAEAFGWTRTLDHPHTFAFVLHYAALFRVLRGGEPPAGEAIDELRMLARGHGFPVWLAGADVMHGRRLTLQGRSQKGISRARKGWADRVATGTRFHETCFLGLLADACRLAGELEEALGHVESALARVEATGERWFEAELHRRRAEFQLAAADRTAAEASLGRALAVARTQEARWWELRAARDLARLWAEEGERQRAQDLLAPVYARFTEGFDTPDLIEAKALLGALG